MKERHTAQKLRNNDLDPDTTDIDASQAIHHRVAQEVV